MRSIYQRLWNRPVAVLAAGTLATSYVVALGWRWLHNLLYYDWVKNNWQPEHFMDYVGGVLGSFYVMLCWSGLYFGIKYYQQLQQQTEQTLKATAAAHQAQLKMLRYQLNPHFLFNTLNAISTLILDGANDTANLAVSRLSDFLRYTLDNDPMKRVTLGSELGALDLYLEIEKVRFGDQADHRERDSSHGRARRSRAQPDTAAPDRKRDQIRNHAERGRRYTSDLGQTARRCAGAAARRYGARHGQWQEHAEVQWRRIEEHARKTAAVLR